MDCTPDRKDCELRIITSNSIPMGGSEVVRWCPKCGAVVVDVDYDGRTNPGQIVPMQFPELAKR